jgi:enolase-phosphatase E1
LSKEVFHSAIGKVGPLLFDGLSDRPPRVYLLDVEGTTSPFSLVSEQLFPYARKHLASFLREHWTEPEVRADLVLLTVENRAESAEKQVPRFAQDDKSFGAGERGPDSAQIESAVAYLLWLMDQDRKSTALKSLQGKIWKSGFLAGELVGTVFPDVPEALDRWSKKARVAIYSSGSVEAQKLLFWHSSAGDLTPFIASYFDTRIGAKTSAESYRAIAAAMGVATGEVLFVSDLVRELGPAREAGCLTRLSVREGNAVVADRKGHVAMRSFAEIE